ncbi:MAG TPA: protein kinase [Bryobacteraceae bacterium]|nr:protein kinase [Bryobacteraceae bacterium]
MTPERWRRVKEIFRQAVECRADTREVFLADSTADDPEVRCEVEKMLRHADGTGLLDRPAWEGLAERELEPGTRLGPYEIASKLGSGGMGSVYKAIDTRLGRTVAIKMLNREFTHRLRLEGRAISALNHPHVCALYDIGDREGYLVMEYIEGESLASRLTRGPLPIEAVLRHGAEIADALAAAHRQGIVHRDLKPANIMITGAGAKVLDFGVAQIAHEAEPAGGEVVGTAAYMSPSQLNGNPADSRSDIFALGLVLYEMATGRRHSWESHYERAGAPAGFARLLDRCLRPDAVQRFQSMDGVRCALEALHAESSGASRRRWRAAVGVGLLAVAAAAAGTAVLMSNIVPSKRPRAQTAAIVESTPASPEPQRPPAEPSSSPRPPASSRPAMVRPVSFAPPAVSTWASYPGLKRDPSLSPDGARMAFSWNHPGLGGYAIYVQPVNASAAPAMLTEGRAEDWGAAWSPDGRRIAFQRRTGQTGIYYVEASGGAPDLVAPIARPGRETLPQVSWSHDGKWIATPDRGPSGGTQIYLFGVDSGEKRRLTWNTTGTDHAPAFSPDGRLLAYADCVEGVHACDLMVVALERDFTPKRERRITQQGVYIRGIAWLPDGRGLVYSAGRTIGADTSLWRVSVNPPGDPQRIDLAGSRARHPTVSQTGGLLAYTRLDGWALMLVRNFR